MKAVLTYHSIDASGSVISIDASTFAAHVLWLASNVTVVPLDKITTSPEPNAVAITFDDGFQNFADVALPLLRDHALPATVFVATDYVGKTNGWSGGSEPQVTELPLMNWKTIERISASGVTIGSHTRTHPNLRHLSRDVLQAEIAGAAEVITTRLGTRPASFAYPYGEFNEAAVDVARDVYAFACTTELRTLDNADDQLLLPRLDAYYFRRAGVLERFGAPSFRRFLWVRRHGRAVRRALAHAGGRA